MKKNYIAPALYSVQVHAEQMIALSLQGGPANKDGEVLVKGSGDWDIFGGDDAGVDVESSDSPFDD